MADLGCISWYALAYLFNQKALIMRKITEIIIHCSATAEGKDFTVEDITRWHKARGFETIGYHYVVYRDGTVHLGRRLERKGAHCVGHNANSLGICYIGGCAADGKTPKDTRTVDQRIALIDLIKELKKQYPNATIHGHNEYAAKACPSFNVKEWIKEMNL
jgi:N-acetylmuramoyl-L-alanine amidase.